jgi:hypothetical protein
VPVPPPVGQSQPRPVGADAQLDHDAAHRVAGAQGRLDVVRFGPAIPVGVVNDARWGRGKPVDESSQDPGQP